MGHRIMNIFKSITYNNFFKGLCALLIFGIIVALVYILVYYFLKDIKTSLLAISLLFTMFVGGFLLVLVASLIGQGINGLHKKYKLKHRDETEDRNFRWYNHMVTHYNMWACVNEFAYMERLIPKGAHFDQYGEIDYISGQLDCGDDDEDPIYKCPLKSIIWKAKY